MGLTFGYHPKRGHFYFSPREYAQCSSSLPPLVNFWTADSSIFELQSLKTMYSLTSFVVNANKTLFGHTPGNKKKNINYIMDSFQWGCEVILITNCCYTSDHLEWSNDPRPRKELMACEDKRIGWGHSSSLHHLFPFKSLTYIVNVHLSFSNFFFLIKFLTAGFNRSKCLCSVGLDCSFLLSVW